MHGNAVSAVGPSPFEGRAPRDRLRVTGCELFCRGGALDESPRERLPVRRNDAALGD